MSQLPPVSSETRRIHFEEKPLVWKIPLMSLMIVLQQTQQESNNTNLLNFIKPKGGGRRRWGHGTGHLKGQDWDNYEETDLSSSALRKNNLSVKSRPGEDSLSR